MLAVKSTTSFNIARKNISDRVPYSIEEKGQTSYIAIGKDKVVSFREGNEIPDFKQNRAIIKPLFKSVRSSATRYLKNNDFQPEVIKADYSSCYYNRAVWDKLPAGEVFYHIDASHCYWRVAFILGYIGKRLYLKYCDDKNLKVLRNVSLSVFNSRQKRTYFERDKMITEIHCDNSLYSLLYNNIRHYTYNNSGKVKDATIDYCISYRVDGVSVLPEGLKKAKAIFKKNGLLFKVSKYIKVDDKNFSTNDGEIKKIA